MISIPLSALSEEMQRQLIAFEDDVREHKRVFAAKKLSSFKFRDEDFELPTEQQDDSESNMSRYMTDVIAEEDEDKDVNEDEGKHEEEIEEEDKKGDRYSIEEVPVPSVPEEIEIIDVDLLDE